MRECDCCEMFGRPNGDGTDEIIVLDLILVMKDHVNCHYSKATEIESSGKSLNATS
jgi:hypothetical protein